MVVVDVELDEVELELVVVVELVGAVVVDDVDAAPVVVVDELVDEVVWPGVVLVVVVGTHPWTKQVLGEPQGVPLGIAGSVPALQI